MWKFIFNPFFSIVSCAVIVFVMNERTLGQDNAILASAYGKGVHAYHSGDFQRSYDELTNAIEAGAQDPRSFYFRGLSALRLGRPDDANADFQAGADAEAAARGNWPVGRSLERIQGEPRLILEKYRRQARIKMFSQQRAAIIRHYSQVEAARPDVQRQKRPDNLPTLAAPDKSAPSPTEEIQPEPPPRSPDEKNVDDQKPAEMVDDPFTEDPAPDPPKKIDDPFGDDDLFK